MSSASQAGARGAEISQIPPIRSFEFDSQAIGRIRSSVNQFRGSVSLPVDLLTLPGREGLDVKLTMNYSSQVNRAVRTWNVEAPTGILGLGWEMPYEYIAVDKRGNRSRTSDVHYLIANGTASRLVQVGAAPDGRLRYQLQSYQFWEILYDPRAERWEIVKEDGSTYVYGGRDPQVGAVQWGVSWGNWIGSSSRLDGQERYPVAWNLASITSVSGHAVRYRYENVEFAVGAAGGARYTQASYLREITDSVGRTVRFIYGEKYGARNPSPKGIVEYQDPHAQRPEPNAYQERYETRYLDQVHVLSDDGQLLLGLTFTYDFINVASTVDPHYGLMWKRCLTSVFRWSPDGTAQPSLRFAYNGPQETNPGALKSVTYPSGGVATYTYKKSLIRAPKRIEVANPLPGSTPRVWHGRDYVVFTYTGRDGAGLRVFVYSWNGRWVGEEITAPGMSSVTLQPESLWVAAQEEFIAVALRNRVAGEDQVYLYRKEPTGFGKWQLDPAGVRRLRLADPASPSTFAAGESFVVAYNPAYSGQAFAGFSWDWQEGVWSRPPVLPANPAPSGAALAAHANYLVVLMYDRDRREGRFRTYHRDATGAWHQSREWTNGGLDILSSEGRLLFAWNPQPAYAVGTYATGTTANSIRYSLRIFMWDESFEAVNPGDPPVVDLETPVSADGRPLYEIFRTVAAGAFVNNNPVNLRYEGGNPANARKADWQRRDFSLENPAAVAVASGDDAAVLCTRGAGGAKNQLLTYDPNRPGSSAWSFDGGIDQSGSRPTLAGGYMTVGRSIYFREPDGTWRLLSVRLESLGDEASVQNCAPLYIAFQDGSGPGARTYVVTLANGSAAAPQPLAGGPQKVYVPSDQAAPGTQLAGPRFLVTYPASERFAESTRLFLYNLDDGNLGEYAVDYPVAFIEIGNPFDPAASFVESFFYGNSDQAQVAYNALTGVAQYPRVVSVPLVRSLSETPPREQPVGRSEYLYSNGLSPQADLAYPDGWIYNYQQVLNGMLLARRDYDSEGRLVQQQINFWSVTKIDAATGKRLYGAYARLVRTSLTRDGVSQTSEVDYDPLSGLERRRTQTYHDADGKAKVLCVETRYAWQVPAYAQAFRKRHYLTAVAQETKSAADTDGGNRRYIESKVTTWKAWGPGSGGGAGEPLLDKWQVYQWTAPGADAPEFDFAAGGAQENWLLISEVRDRTEAGGLIREQVDVAGVPTSFLYDREERRLVATFPGGSLLGGEVNYWGMESYEPDPVWRLGAGARVAPADGEEVDAHTGSRCLLLGPGATGDAGARAVFTPARAQAYAFSAWVKVPEGYDPAQGEARFVVAVGDQQPVSVPFPAAAGDWVYVEQRIDVRKAGESVTITTENANARCAVRVDDLRFSPWGCLWTGLVYGDRFGYPTARLEANGVTSRTVYDAFGEPVFTTNAADRLGEITARYFSRSGNQGAFSVADPNHRLTIRPGEAGELSTFSRGGEWRRRWRPDPDGAWEVRDGRLCSAENAGEASLTLARDGSELGAGYVVAAAVEPLAALTRPVGVRVGSDLTILWDPQAAEWRCVDGAGNTLASVDPVRFTLPADCGPGLDAGTVSDEVRRRFAEADHPLGADACAVPLTGLGGWEIAAGGGALRYFVKRKESELAAYRLGKAWTLQVQATAVLFWVDGQLIFSLSRPVSLQEPPRLFFGDRVALAYLASGLAPATTLVFEDAAGNSIQEQALEAGRASVLQRLTDSLGREAVVTKAAWVGPAAGRRLLDYVQDFARLDWTSGVMSGLVSEAYPEDGGFPYSRECYEASPLGRVIEYGLPGADFRVGAHSTRVRYGANDGSYGLPARRYAQAVTTDPNGVETVEISTLLGQVVCKTAGLRSGAQDEPATSFTRYDDAGNPVELRSPNYYRPPAGSVADDWVTRQDFDYAGRIVRVAVGNPEREGVTEMVYDPAGNLRFLQDPQGARDGCFNYWKYDRFGRVIESGYVQGVWDRSELERRARTDPAWPEAPATWRRRNFWDGDDPGARSAGRVHRVEAQNGGDGKADVVETYAYDVFGNTVSVSTAVAGFDEYRVGYAYDDAGCLRRIAYPGAPGGDGWQVKYTYDALRRVRAIGATPGGTDPLVTYDYRADGRPERTEFWPAGAQRLARAYSFNPPQWFAGVQDAVTDVRLGSQSALFRESLAFTSGGYGGEAYFDGKVAAAHFRSFDGRAFDFAYSYSALGNIENAECGQDPSWNLGVVQPVAYDLNGNVAVSPRGGAVRQFIYEPGTQRVARVVNAADGSDIARYTYNQSGAVLTAETSASPFGPARRLTFTYDPGIKLAREVAEAGGTRLRLLYGGGGERVVKEVWEGDRLARRRLYIRGANVYPLLERTTGGEGGGATISYYVYGPDGLAGVYRDGEFYAVLKDHLGSVRQVVAADGRVVAGYDFLTFGEIARAAEPEPGFMPYLYTGQEYDAEIGLYNYRARFYSSEIGRFLDVDPGRQFFSPYIYAANNPILYVDPTGKFSLKSLFSAIGGILIGAVEILIGVVIDVVAGVLEVVTGGLSTPASVALAALSGTFYGAGVSAIVYSATNVGDFSWKEYGIQMGIGAVTGAIAAGFSALGSAAAEGLTGVKAAVQAGEQVSRAARVANTLIDASVTAAGGFISGVAGAGIYDAAHNVNPGLDVALGGAWSAVSGWFGKAIPALKVKEGWGELGKRIVTNVAKREASGVAVTLTRNAANGDPLDKGLVSAVVSGAAWGVVGGLGVKDVTKQALDIKWDFGEIPVLY